MFLFFHPTSSQISVNVSTTTVTTTTEAVRLPLSLTLSSTSEGTICTPATLTGETEDESMEKVDTLDLKQEDDARAVIPHFPTHPFRNARRTTIANAPSTPHPFSLHSDPCPFPFPSPPSLPQSRRGSFSSQHAHSNMHPVKLSTRFKFAKLLHFIPIPAGSKNRSRKERQKKEAVGYHYRRARDQLQQEGADKGEKSPNTLWGSEDYM